MNEEKPKITVGILTVSDRCFQGQTEDISGGKLCTLINSGSLILNAQVAVRECVPDELENISEKLVIWADELHLNLILTTGGTGFSPRDVTPEATKSVIEREAPGLSLAMIKGSLDITPLAMLSRPVCGIRRRSLIINLPGSPKAVQECLQMISPSLKHAVDLICGSWEVESTHKKMQERILVDQKPIATAHSFCHHHQHNPAAVAFRPRSSPYPMISVQEAQGIVLNSCSFLGTEESSYLDVVNRVLATDVTAQDPLPPFPASMKDGYAVLASDGPGRRRVIAMASIAGSQPEAITVSSGFCARISTGAPLPPGADAVVMVEETKLLKASDDGTIELEIEIMTRVLAGQEIRPIGSDISAGQVVLKRETVLTAADVGLLATVGRNSVQVFAQPTIAVLSTGNELEDCSGSLKTGRIRDSNRPTLISLLRQHGLQVIDAGIAKDETETLYERMSSALDKADVLVSTGGVSMGEKDLLRHVLMSKFSAQVHFGRVDMKPGKPTTFATFRHSTGQTKFVFGLPGNPVSAVVTCHLYVIPACKKLSGHTKVLPTKIKAELQGPSSFQLDMRPEYHRVLLQWQPDRSHLPIAISTGNQLSCRLLSLNRANGLAILPAKSQGVSSLANGSTVDVIVIDQL